ncbi:MAG: hypothetical protein JO267_07035 [Alphaproteobacteria bacterium]|nr:hypothetical protein [Alphaproteobacteria bacterium]
MTQDTISLGAETFTIPPISLGQLRLLLDALDGMAGKSAGGLVDAAAKIVHAGLLRARPGLTLDDVLAMEATLDQLNDAVAAVIRKAGLVRREHPEHQARGYAGEDAGGGAAAGALGEESPVTGI